MKKLLLALLFLPVMVHAQGSRSDPFPSFTTQGIFPGGTYPPLLLVPFSKVTICGYPAAGFPCTNFATTYTDATLTTACPITSPIVWNGSAACVKTTDAFGRFGFWLKPGNYTYTITNPLTGQVQGPYSFTNGGLGTGSSLPTPTEILGGKGDGTAVALAEKGISVSGSVGTIAWSDDFNGGVYDPRDPRWGSQATPALQAVAFQNMSDKMACDLAMGIVTQAKAKIPQGNFYVDELQLAPGSTWEGVAQADGGSTFHTFVNNHYAMLAPASMTMACSDGNSHTDNVALSHVSHITLVGCSVGGCTNASGDTPNYTVGGPYNTGLEMSSNGIVEHVLAQDFGGYGVRVDGQDAKSFHNRTYSNDAWFYYGGYKGVTESVSSTEVSAVVTGSTGSVALTWAAVSGASGYVIYRGTSAGGESVFYQSSTNSYTDTGATSASGPDYGVVTNSLTAPAVTATPSTTGGSLTAATYYYKVTATVADGWHASYEAVGLDGMADWIEIYGLFDIPTIYTYHHIADFLGAGGFSRFGHIWPQLGQVGIAQPLGGGTGESYENLRVDFTRLEGMYITDWNVQVHGGVFDGSCTATNAQTINTGQEGSRFSGQCNQLWSTGSETDVSDIFFTDNDGFGPTYKTADIMTEGGSSQVHNVPGASYQLVPVEGLLGGLAVEPSSYNFTNVTQTPVYGTANITGLKFIYLADTAAANYWSFTGVRVGGDFYVAGGNSNVVLENDNNHITLCAQQNVNLGTVHGYMHFLVTGQSSDLMYGSGYVQEICPSPPPTIGSSETVTFSATPTFSTATRASIITLSASVTGFTLAAGIDGQEKTLTFCQNSTGSFTVTAPSNVHGFFTVGTTASKCSSQHFTYSAVQTAWLADSSGVTNE